MLEGSGPTFLCAKKNEMHQKKYTWSPKKCLSSHARNIFFFPYVPVSIWVFSWGSRNTKISQAALCLVGQVRCGRWASRPGPDSWNLLLGRRTCPDQVQHQEPRWAPQTQDYDLFEWRRLEVDGRHLPTLQCQSSAHTLP